MDAVLLVPVPGREPNGRKDSPSSDHAGHNDVVFIKHLNSYVDPLNTWRPIEALVAHREESRRGNVLIYTADPCQWR